MSVNDNTAAIRVPDLAAVVTLFKPITWFPPMWAYLCGIVSAGGVSQYDWGLVLVGLLLTGPVVCGMSQVVNDWSDRHVDAINEPDRPIPSGRVSPIWAFWIAVTASLVGLTMGTLLGPWGFGATVLAIVCAWAYSAEPVRLKRSGWFGPGLVGLCYEGLPWITGAVVISGGAPAGPVLFAAALYALGAHGIMTLNDFKALEGDRVTGIRSLPVTLGPERAARLACFVMAVPQVVVIAGLVYLDRPIHAAIIGVLVALQVAAMRVLLTDPRAKAPWYNGTGVTLYVLGMLVCAFALGNLGTTG